MKCYTTPTTYPNHYVLGKVHHVDGSYSHSAQDVGQGQRYDASLLEVPVVAFSGGVDGGEVAPKRHGRHHDEDGKEDDPHMVRKQDVGIVLGHIR